jgi:molybdopterin-guanine dinucleotide biosynthesis protein A
MHPTFSAVLLAGGKSTRMGRDKACLQVEWEGASISLWERQLAVLQSTTPEKLFISGTRKPGYPASVTVLEDDWPDVGPLGGIATCLRRSKSASLLVLAVDLPLIQPGFLEKLLARCVTGCGVVPAYQNRFEPLIAVYPASALSLAIDLIRERNYALQDFVTKLLKNHLIVSYEVEASEQVQLKNCNTPEDARSFPRLTMTTDN